MSRPDESLTIPALAARLRKTEILAAIAAVAVAVIAFTLLAVLTDMPRGPMEPDAVLITLGLGFISAAALITIRSFVFIGPLSHEAGPDGAMSGRVRKAVLRNDDSALSDDERDRAPRWAALNALNLRSQLTSSVMMVLGLGSSMVPQLLRADTVPLVWILGALLAGILILDAFTLRRMLRFRQYAHRTGGFAS